MSTSVRTGLRRPQSAIMAEMFPTRMRYPGVSLGYQVTSIVAGSLAGRAMV
jgi:hypothetical protein